jgi:hypothetical protein
MAGGDAGADAGRCARRDIMLPRIGVARAQYPGDLTPRQRKKAVKKYWERQITAGRRFSIVQQRLPSPPLTFC